MCTLEAHIHTDVSCVLQFEAVLPGIDVVKLVANAPNLLVYDVEGTIPKKVQRLQVLLPGVDVVKLVSSSPHLLTFDIENNIAPKVEQLYKLLPGNSSPRC